MLMPSIFGEDLFDDLFDLPFYDDSKVEKKLYGRHAKNLMKTDIKEMDNGYELIIDLPGFKKDEIKVSLMDICPSPLQKVLIRMSRRKIPESTSGENVMQVPASVASISVRI